MASEAKPVRAPAVAGRPIPRESLLNPWPELSARRIITIVVVVVVLLWSLNGTNANLGTLAEGVPNMADFVVRLFPPRFDLAPAALAVPAPLQGTLGETVTLTIPRVVPYLVETLQMAFIGTLLGVVLALPFGLLAARNVAPRPWIYTVTRLLLNINRAIPDIIFALIFVAAVGLGPFGGVLALGVGAIGTLAKLYAESIEAIDPQQTLAVRATGASPLQTFRYGVLPQALPLMASYTLLLFESNVRSATILGLVGAGGVGFILSKYISLFQYRELMGALIFIIVMVTLIDWLSGLLRKRLI
jgi:phosphonate transport system permease protein